MLSVYIETKLPYFIASSVFHFHLLAVNLLVFEGFLVKGIQDLFLHVMVNLVICSDGVSTPYYFLIIVLHSHFTYKNLVHERRLKYEIPKLRNQM